MQKTMITSAKVHTPEEVEFLVERCEYPNGIAFRVSCVGGYLADGEDHLEFRTLKQAMQELHAQQLRTLEVR